MNTSSSLESLYLIASALVAAGIWMQAVALRKNAGRVPDNIILHFFSFLDLIWLLVSGVALYFLNFDNLSICVPVVHVIYSVLSFFYAGYTIKEETMPSSADEVEIIFDNRYIDFCQSFAMVFVAMCLFFLYALKQGIAITL